MTHSTARADWRTPTLVLVASGVIITLAMGIRHSFGLFLQPMSADLHWGRQTFALAIAIQNLVWGASQPFTGMIADKYGSGRVVLGGALLYVLGLREECVVIECRHGWPPSLPRARRENSRRACG